MQSIKSTVGLCVVFISIVLVMFFFSKLRVPELSADEMRTQGVFILPTPRDIGPFELLDHTGAVFNRQSLEGHWSFIFFGFTNCPDVCPTTLSVLNDAISALDDPPTVVMVSVDPDRDTPERLAQYVPAFNPNFIGYTGTFEETVKLAAQPNIAFGKVPGLVPGSYLVDHSASLVLIDPDGRYAGFIKAPHNSSSIQRVIRGLSL